MCRFGAIYPYSGVQADKPCVLGFQPASCPSYAKETGIPGMDRSGLSNGESKSETNPGGSDQSRACFRKKTVWRCLMEEGGAPAHCCASPPRYSLRSMALFFITGGPPAFLNSPFGIPDLSGVSFLSYRIYCSSLRPDIRLINILPITVCRILHPFRCSFGTQGFRVLRHWNVN
jgi:hypothetical protein